ncbi:MAG: GNAT family N-acetyltransferase [Tannerella sp.]|jgi:ribosomal-protein-serine acetyltransferase|nr:GNAT family N-acetyltransferase [Tannerella sp.]
MQIIRLNETTKLRQLEITDVPDIYKAIDSQRGYLREFLPFVDHTKKTEDTRAFVEGAVNAAVERNEYTFVILVENNFAGLVGFKDLDKKNLKVEIGYWLCEQYQHRGIMTSAVKALCELAFKDLQLNRIQIKCATGNIRSKHIPIRLGFKMEGLERQGELMHNGTFADLEIYSILKND